MKKTRLLPGLLFLCLIGILCGCSSGAKKTEVTEGEPHDSTPVVLVPTADGQDTIEEDGVILDISNKEIYRFEMGKDGKKPSADDFVMPDDLQ